MRRERGFTLHHKVRFGFDLRLVLPPIGYGVGRVTQNVLRRGVFETVVAVLVEPRRLMRGRVKGNRRHFIPK